MYVKIVKRITFIQYVRVNGKTYNILQYVNVNGKTDNIYTVCTCKISSQLIITRFTLLPPPVRPEVYIR